MLAAVPTVSDDDVVDVLADVGGLANLDYRQSSKMIFDKFAAITDYPDTVDNAADSLGVETILAGFRYTLAGLLVAIVLSYETK